MVIIITWGMKYVKGRGCRVDNIMKHHMGRDSKIQTPFIIAELRFRVHAWALVLFSLTKRIFEVSLFISLADESSGICKVMPLAEGHLSFTGDMREENWVVDNLYGKDRISDDLGEKVIYAKT